MTNPTRTRAEIQAEIISTVLNDMPESPLVGDRVKCLGTVVGFSINNYIPNEGPVMALVKFDGDFDATTEIHLEAIDAAADLIPRAEHERAVEEAVNKALNGDLAAEETAYALGAINARVRCRNENDALNVLVKDYANESPIRLEKEHDGHTYRVTVERVGPAEQSEQDSDTPIGYVNVFYDGGPGSVHGSAEEAATVAEFLGGVKETAVPLYRHPAPPQGTAVAPKGVVEELRSLVYDVIDAARRCSSDPKPSKEYHAAWDAITAALSRITELQQTAVVPKGVVEELRREATRIRKGQSSSHESHARWLDHIAAQITELPEPSEWAWGTVVFTKAFWPEPWTDEQCRDLAAALIERAKEVDRE